MFFLVVFSFTTSTTVSGGFSVSVFAGISTMTSIVFSTVISEIFSTTISLEGKLIVSLSAVSFFLTLLLFGDGEGSSALSLTAFFALFLHLKMNKITSWW